MKKGEGPPNGVKELVLKLAGRNPRPTNKGICDDVKREFGEGIEISERTVGRYCEKAGLPTNSRRAWGSVPRIALPDQEPVRQLLKGWRKQLQDGSLAWYLRRFFIENLEEDRESRSAESPEAAELYLEAQRHHLKNIPRLFKISLPVQQEPLYAVLKRSYPREGVWQAQDLWATNSGIYLEAFFSFICALTMNIDESLGLTLVEGGERVSNRKVADGLRLIHKVRRSEWGAELSLRLLTCVTACDVLMLEIRDRPSQGAWYPHLQEIEELRHRAVRLSQKAPRQFWLTGGRTNILAIAREIRRKDPDVRKKVGELLDAFWKRQLTQSDVINKIGLLEDRLHMI